MSHHQILRSNGVWQNLPSDINSEITCAKRDGRALLVVENQSGERYVVNLNDMTVRILFIILIN